MSKSIQVEVVISDQSYAPKLMISDVRNLITSEATENFEQLVVAAVAKGRMPNMVAKDASTFFHLHTSTSAVGRDFFFLIRVSQRPIGIGTISITTYSRMLDELERTRQNREAEKLKQHYQSHFDEHGDFNILEERGLLIFEESFRGMAISAVTAMAYDRVARRLGCRIIVCDQAAIKGEGSQRWLNHSKVGGNKSQVVINLPTVMGTWQVIELQ